ncbi:MAG: M48 family metalloprotease [Planctomycetes bacterium]|nr:M48 family metalloprotease [Planctomycetota bacterium]
MMTETRPSHEAILSAFRGAVPPGPPSIAYRAGLLLVTVMMVLLPLAYVGLIVLAGYGVYYHATEHLSILAHGRVGFGRLIVYAGPLVVGAILVLFMIKPLFARSGRRERRRVLDPKREPLLFDFVAKIAALVGAPRPREIRADCEVNASASFRRGFLSFLGNDLVLTIGLPLVAGLDLRRFAGVLAHEFGHFAQGSGMRLTYLVRSVNLWFARVVYERDEWDERLVEWSEGSDLRIGIVLWVARFFVWLTRRVLWLLMMAGHAISMFMCRQMEYDADRYEIRLAGSTAFRDTARRLPLLDLARGIAFQALQRAWAEGRLGDNLPALVLLELGRISAEDRERFLAEHLGRKAGLGDTHPADGARIERALRANEPGIFAHDGPAADLFSDFEGLSKAETLAFYRENVGEKITAKNLVATGEVLRQQEALGQDAECCARFFQGHWNNENPPFLPAGEGTEPPTVERLRSLRARFDGLMPRVRPEVGRFRESEEQVRALERAHTLVRAGVKIRAADFGLARGSVDEVQSALQKGRAARKEALAGLAEAEVLMRDRFAAALLLYRDPAMVAKVRGADLAAESPDALLAVWAGIGDVYLVLQRLLKRHNETGLLLEHAEGNQALIRRIMAELEEVRKLMGTLKAGLGGLVYPFDHADGGVTIADYAVRAIPPVEQVGLLMDHSGETLRLMFDLMDRVSNRLAFYAERMEEAAGLPPLPTPA